MSPRGPRKFGLDVGQGGLSGTRKGGGETGPKLKGSRLPRTRLPRHELVPWTLPLSSIPWKCGTCRWQTYVDYGPEPRCGHCGGYLLEGPKSPIRIRTDWKRPWVLA